MDLPEPPSKPTSILNGARYVTAAEAVRRLLSFMGEDTEREGLKNTPNRVVRFYEEFCCEDEPFNLTTFEGEGYDEVIVQRKIPFYSLCEHHLLPFFGTATVAYLPDVRIVGLSKLARALQHFARRPQNQERLTTHTAEYLDRELQPHGVAVVVTARHLCMEMRGVKAPGTETLTSHLIGEFRENPALRKELFDLTR